MAIVPVFATVPSRLSVVPGSTARVPATVTVAADPSSSAVFVTSRLAPASADTVPPLTDTPSSRTAPADRAAISPPVLDTVPRSSSVPFAASISPAFTTRPTPASSVSVRCDAWITPPASFVRVARPPPSRP